MFWVLLHGQLTGKGHPYRNMVAGVPGSYCVLGLTGKGHPHRNMVAGVPGSYCVLGTCFLFFGRRVSRVVVGMLCPNESTKHPKLVNRLYARVASVTIFTKPTVPRMVVHVEAGHQMAVFQILGCLQFCISGASTTP